MALGVSLFLSMLPHVLVESKFGSLGEEVSESPRVEGFVIDGGRRVGGGFGSGHLEES